MTLKTRRRVNIICVCFGISTMEDAVQYVYDYLEDNIPDYEWEFPEEGFLRLNRALLIIFLCDFLGWKLQKAIINQESVGCNSWTSSWRLGNNLVFNRFNFHSHIFINTFWAHNKSVNFYELELLKFSLCLAYLQQRLIISEP